MWACEPLSSPGQLVTGSQSPFAKNILPARSSCLDQSCNVRKSDNLECWPSSRTSHWRKEEYNVHRIYSMLYFWIPLNSCLYRRTPFFFVFQIFSRSKLATFPHRDQWPAPSHPGPETSEVTRAGAGVSSLSRSQRRMSHCHSHVRAEDTSE